MTEPHLTHVIERTGIQYSRFHAVDRERDSRHTLCGLSINGSYDLDHPDQVDCQRCRKLMSKAAVRDIEQEHER